MSVINTFQIDRIAKAMERQGANFANVQHDAQLARIIETCIKVTYKELGPEGIKELLND